MNLSKLTNCILAILMTLFIASCAITEELWIEKNGSGKYEMLMDMGQVYPMIAMMDTTGSMDDVEAQDTTIFFSAFAESDSFDLSALDRPELLEKVSVRIKMDPTESEMMFGMITEFDYLEEIREIYEQVSKIQNLKKAKDENPASMENILDLAKEEGVGFSWKKGKLSRTPQTMDDEELKEMGSEDMDPEEMAMMKSMFGNMEMKTIVHLPGKVKKVSDPNAKIVDKKTVIFTYDLFEIMEKGEYGAFEITYK